MSSSMNANMKRLLEQRDKLLKEIEALKNKVEGIEMAMGLLDRNDGAGSRIQTGKRRSNVKAHLIDLLTEAGTRGLNAATAVEMSQRRGIPLERPTASSILSRMKADGIAVYDGESYRLKRFSEKPSPISDLIQ